MNILTGIGSGAYGAFIGGVIWYFVSRMGTYTATALDSVLVLVGGAGVLYIIQALGKTDPATNKISLACYPIGLLIGWAVPGLVVGIVEIMRMH